MTRARKAGGLTGTGAGGVLGAGGRVGGDAAALGEEHPLLRRHAERLQRGPVHEDGAHARRLRGRRLLERVAARLRRRVGDVQVARARHELRTYRRRRGRGGHAAGDGHGDGDGHRL